MRLRRRLLRVEQLESRTLLAGSDLLFDFGPARAPVEPGAIQVTAKTLYSAGLGYGWQSRLELKEADRRIADPLRRDFVYGAGPHEFLANVDNGVYQVRAILGDASGAHDNMSVFAEGALKASGLNSMRGVFIETLFEVEIRDNVLDLVIDDLGGRDPDVVLNGLELRRLSTSPGFDLIPDQTTAEDSGAKDVTITGVKSGAPSASSDSVILSAVSNQPSIVPNPTISGDGDTRTLRFTPAAHANGSAGVTVTATDASGNTFQQKFTINVASVNDPPSFDPIANQTVPENSGQTNVTVTGIGPGPGNESGQAVRLTAVSSNPAIVPNPTISGTGGTRTLSFTPAANADGQVTITVTAKDNGGTANGGVDSFLRTFTIDVTPQGQPPAFAPIPDQAVAEDSGAKNVTITGVTPGSGDSSSSDVVLSAVSSQTSVVPNPTITGSGDTRTLTFTPAANANGAAVITVTATGRDGASSQRTFNINMSAVNDAPAFDSIANRSVADDSGNNTVPITGVSAGPANESAQTVTLTAASSNTAIVPHPTVTGTGASRRLTFAPIAESEGTVTITVSARDNGGTANGGADLFQRTFTITVTHDHADPGAPDYEQDVIVTHHDRIPNFARHPTITITQSGRWSQIPELVTSMPSDVVFIAEGADVVFDVHDAHVATLGIAGALRFAPDQNTHLTVANLMVYSAGLLEIGTAPAPIQDHVTAGVTFSDTPLDLALDPSQYGNGLIAFGKVRMHGGQRPGFVRLAQEPLAGHTTLVLSEPAVQWRPGDQLFLPDTRQLGFNNRGSNYVSQGENLTIAGVSADGTVITFAAPLQFGHSGARDGDGVLDFLPHVSNQTRNIRLASANPAGMRGHVMLSHRADIDVRYAQLRDLGRTTNAPLNSTTFDQHGNVTHIGTNQIGRYPLHVHHVLGPHEPQPNGYQYTLIGNAIDGGPQKHQIKWGLTLHGSHYGLIRDNVIYNWAGSGLVTEDGNESYNVIEHNFIAAVHGPGGRADTGRGREAYQGNGMWFRGPNNYVRGNVVANVYGTGNGESFGFTIALVRDFDVKIPIAPGSESTTTVNIHDLPILDFAGNEVYGTVATALTYWYIGLGVDGGTYDSMPESVIKDLRAWHFHQYGIQNYPSVRVTYDGFVARGDIDLLRVDANNVGVEGGDYRNDGMIVRNADIQNLKAGIVPPTRTDAVELIRIEDSLLRNYHNVVLITMFTSAPPTEIQPRRVIVEDVLFALPPILNERRGPMTHIAMSYNATRDGVHLVMQDELHVYNFNRVEGDNFRVFYNEQRADFIVPESRYRADGRPLLIAAPVPGLTNAELWAQYQLAVAGQVAPAEATTRDRIHGLVVPLIDTTGEGVSRPELASLAEGEADAAAALFVFSGSAMTPEMSVAESLWTSQQPQREQDNEAIAQPEVVAPLASPSSAPLRIGRETAESQSGSDLIDDMFADQDELADVLKEVPRTASRNSR